MIQTGNGQPEKRDDFGRISAIRHIVNELSRGHPEPAARFFLQGQVQGLFPTNGDIPKWLAQNLGNEVAKRLISAFIHLPCFNCNRGIVPCESCEGKGHTDTEIICDFCLGLGVATCDFCAGTGWATIDYVPAGLQSLVLAGRVKVAQKRINGICSKILFMPTPEQAFIRYKEYAELLVRLNRQISVLESVSQDIEQLNGTHQRNDSKKLKIIHSCVSSATRGRQKTKEIIKAMSLLSKIQYENCSDKLDICKAAAAREELYKSVAGSSDGLSGTFLEHPFIEEVIKKIRPAKNCGNGKEKTDSDWKKKELNKKKKSFAA